MSNILLTNEKRSKMDLSAVKDAEGKMVILQPKGAAGSTRECLAEVLEHPHVVSMINAKWLSHKPVSLAPADQATSVPVQPPTLAAQPPVAPPEAPSDEAPPVAPPEAPSDEAPPVLEEVIATSETTETTDPMTTDKDFAVSSSPGTKKEKRGRRDD